MKNSLPRLGPTAVAAGGFADNCRFVLAEAENAEVLIKAYVADDNTTVVRSFVIAADFTTFLEEKNNKVRAQEFVQGTRHVGRTVGSEAFPDAVPYPTHCIGACGRRSSREAAMVAAVTKMLTEAASWCRGPCKVPEADMLLLVQATTPHGRYTMFWWMTTATNQRPQHAATQTYWRCEPYSGTALVQDLAGIQLQIVRGPLVQTEQGMPPFNRQARPPCFFDEAEV